MGGAEIPLTEPVMSREQQTRKFGPFSFEKSEVVIYTKRIEISLPHCIIPQSCSSSSPSRYLDDKIRIVMIKKKIDSIKEKLTVLFGLFLTITYKFEKVAQVAPCLH